MSLAGDLSNTEVELQKCQGDVSYLANSSGGDDRHLDTGKMEEDEEDIDFNPFLAAESLSEASSSLSSEDEISGEIGQNRPEKIGKNHPEIKDTNQILSQGKYVGNKYWEVVTESTHFSGANGEASAIPKPYKKRPFASNSAEVGTVGHSKLYVQTNALDDEDNASKDSVNNKNTHKASAHASISSQKLRIENEDAIFRRTRARHSLVDYTLEELEAFLQESDDDDSAHNVDDEEEYKKFLTAVLRGGDNEGKEDKEDDNIDEDEENDADFEIEIEEALESDMDENIENDRCTKRGLGSNGHAPETRQKRSHNNKKMPVSGSSIPLRPLLPLAIDSQSVALPLVSLRSASFTNFDGSTSLLPSSWTSPVDTSQGFTTTQIGQLYCLLHEHVQLLIQLFSLSILDPSWYHIANLFKKMIIELTEKREEALSGTRAYPAACFDSLHIYLSEKTACNQASDCCPYVPLVRNPIISILDVATLSLAREYLSDVSHVVSKYRSCQIEADSDKSHLIKKALFPTPNCIYANETTNDGREGATCENGIHRLASSQIKQKKSLAAELIENARKQPIAQVPKGIADLAQRFLPIFNSALFPRKPPSPAISKRIYFTESEDRLLAMGLLEYNNDWAAIQQHFLPSKSRHQIFVRQKNRSSAKAPENPIKVVRRMKTSPLTADEMTLVSMGLKMFTNDWTAVWKNLVPHRDPSLLARQWRTARGAQKSYRKSGIEKEKRRIYESKRRKRKSIERKQTASGKEVDDSSANDNINEDDEAPFQEAFSPEPDPGSSKTMPTITSQAGTVPYHHNNAAAPKVIKLAPDLPPVNLPPTVRVISQSAFQSYHGVSLAPMVNHGDSKIGNNLMESKGSNDVPSNNCHRNAPALDSSSNADQLSVGDSHLGSDSFMHPLSFSRSENGCVSDCTNICATASTTQNLKTHSSQYNSCNLGSKGTGKVSSSEGHRKELPRDIRTIDFHPILQRSDDLDGASCNIFSDNHNISVPVTVSCEENDIDLDIHLSSTVNKDKTRTSVIKANQPFGSRSRSRVVPEHGRVQLPAQMTSSFTKKHNSAVIMLDNSIVSNKEFAGDPTEMPLQGHSAQIDGENNTADAFLGDIVMEQEELSDSDDETEHVQFEYEEMDDSEEELLNCEPIQNQDVTPPQLNEGDLAVKLDASKKPHRTGSSSKFNQPFAGCTPKTGSSKSTSLKPKQKAGIRIARQAPQIGILSHLIPRKVHANKGPKVRSSRMTKN